VGHRLRPDHPRQGIAFGQPHPAAEEPGRPHAAPARRRAGVPFRAGRAGRRRRGAGAAREALAALPPSSQRETMETRLTGGFTQCTRTPCWRASFSTSAMYSALGTILVSATVPLSTAAGAT